MTEEHDATAPGVALVLAEGAELMRLQPLPSAMVTNHVRVSGSVLAALGTVGAAVPALQTAIKAAATTGDALQVVFPPAVMKGLRDGSLHLMKAKDGLVPVAVNSGGQIVKQGRIAATATAGAAGGVGGAAATMTLGSAAVIALPVVIAGAAAYAQHREIQRVLASILQVVERIEQRLEDADTGVCDAADQFLALVEEAWAEGGITDYLRTELAAQRTATEALYAARRRWVERFKVTLEQEQTALEKKKERTQPWVDSVADLAKGGRLESELILFVRALLSRTKLGVVAAAALAEDGRAATALNLIDRLERELRSEFFDLHNRLVPLSKYAPEGSLLQKLPGLGASLSRAHSTVRTLVDHLNAHVLPLIPDPYADREVLIELDAASVLELAELVG